jgi:triosephosphate isomerase (TIM)
MNDPLVVGNWKMHGGQAECLMLARAVVRDLKKNPCRAVVALAPPFTALGSVGNAIRQAKVKLAAQNCHWHESGAFTGEISPGMLTDLGCEYVILGHSERRHLFGEGDEMIAHKVIAAIARNLRVILCVGETLEERRRGLTAKIIARQLRSALKGFTKDAIEKLEIAYEPVWAIGTGQNATTTQVNQVHRRIRKLLRASFGLSMGSRVRILYGGSVKPENAGELAALDEVDGLLVGGASLKGETFLPIVRVFG